jgi:hypothetical protein
MRELARSAAYLMASPLPDDAHRAVDAATDYVERLAHTRTQEVKAEWSYIHAGLVAAAKTLEAD